MDDGIEDLIATTEFFDDEDTDSIVAPSEISFFSDFEADEMSTELCTDSDSEVYTVQEQINCPVQTPSNDLSLTGINEMPETDLDSPDSVQQAENTTLQTDPLQTTVYVNTNSPTTPQLSLPSCDSNSQLHPSGFTIVGDNIDKNFRPSYQRQDRQTKLLHYFHAYAAKNRVDVSSLSDTRPAAILSPESTCQLSLT